MLNFIAPQGVYPLPSGMSCFRRQPRTPVFQVTHLFAVSQGWSRVTTGSWVKRYCLFLAKSPFPHTLPPPQLLPSVPTSVTTVSTCQHLKPVPLFDDLLAGHHPCTSPKICADYSLLSLHNIYDSSQGGAVCSFKLQYTHYFKNCICKQNSTRYYWKLAPTKCRSLLLSVPMQRPHFPQRFLKIRLYNPSVMSVLLKTWSIVQVDKKRHDMFDSRCSGRMCAIKWQWAQRERFTQGLTRSSN